MVSTIVIFWSAVAALCLFVITTLIQGLIAAMRAMNSVISGKMFKAFFYTVLAGIVLYIIQEVLFETIRGDILETITALFTVGLAMALIGIMVAALYKVAQNRLIINKLLNFILAVLEAMAGISYRAYGRLLKRITDRMDKG